MTGDMAFADEDGYYYISGRKKRFIKLQGRRIGLDRLQEYLQEILDSEDVVCTGTDDRGVIIWIADDSLMERKDEIEELFAGKFGIRSRFLHFNLIDEIPRNSSGKTVYAKLGS